MEQDPPREDLSNVYLLFTWGKVFLHTLVLKL